MHGQLILGQFFSYAVGFDFLGDCFFAFCLIFPGGLKQFVRGLVRLEKDNDSYSPNSPGREAQRLLDSAKWRLWNGKVDGALERLDELSDETETFEDEYSRFDKQFATQPECLRFHDVSQLFYALLYALRLGRMS